jgi:hypothetical protein
VLVLPAVDFELVAEGAALDLDSFLVLHMDSAEFLYLSVEFLDIGIWIVLVMMIPFF